MILLDGGSAIYGLPFAGLSRGESVVTLMNTAGYDAMAVGEGELRYGLERLLELEKEMDFPLLSANLVRKDNQEALMPATAVIEKKGIRYGVFAVVSQELTDDAASVFDDDWKVLDYIEKSQKAVTLLQSMEVDYIIALAHMEAEGENRDHCVELAQQVQGIDVMISGHGSHWLPEGKTVGSTLILSCDENLNGIGVLHIDAEGKRHPGRMTSKEFIRRDFYLDTIAEQITEQQRPLLQQVVVEHVTPQNDEKLAKGELALGHLAADVMRESTGAEIALLPSAYLCAELPKGKVTRQQLIALFVPGMEIVTCSMTGSQLKEILEHSVSTYPAAMTDFMQVSGITVSFDSQKPVGSRVEAVKVQNQALSELSSYQVALPKGFGSWDGLHAYGTLDDMMYDYAIKHKTLDTKTEKRVWDVREQKDTKK